jgi:hypothetical protein
VTVSRVLFSSAKEKWATPPDVYAALDAEFGFTLDPCPIEWAPETHENGLSRSWAGHRVYCNPPYGPAIGAWLGKAREADLAVYLLPARTDTRWWHERAMLADEIRFLRGRLRFGGQLNPAPFPSCVVIFRRQG